MVCADQDQAGERLVLLVRDAEPDPQLLAVDPLLLDVLEFDRTFRPQPLAVTDLDCDRSLIDLTDSSRAAGQGEQFKVHLLVIDRAVEIAGGEGALCRERQAEQRNRQ